MNTAAWIAVLACTAPLATAVGWYLGRASAPARIILAVPRRHDTEGGSSREDAHRTPA